MWHGLPPTFLSNRIEQLRRQALCPRISVLWKRGRHTSARLGTVVRTACMVALSRSKPWHTGKGPWLNRPQFMNGPVLRSPRGAELVPRNQNDPFAAADKEATRAQNSGRDQKPPRPKWRRVSTRRTLLESGSHHRRVKTHDSVQRSRKPMPKTGNSRARVQFLDSLINRRKN